MIDSGADRDVISEWVTEFLDLETSWTDLRVVTVDNEISSKRKLAKFSIESLEDNYCADVSDGLVGKILTGEADIPPHRRDIASMPHLADITFPKMRREGALDHRRGSRGSLASYRNTSRRRNRHSSGFTL